MIRPNSGAAQTIELLPRDQTLPGALATLPSTAAALTEPRRRKDQTSRVASKYPRVRAQPAACRGTEAPAATSPSSGSLTWTTAVAPDSGMEDVKATIIDSKPKRSAKPFVSSRKEKVSYSFMSIDLINFSLRLILQSYSVFFKHNKNQALFFLFICLTFFLQTFVLYPKLRDRVEDTSQLGITIPIESSAVNSFMEDVLEMQTDSRLGKSVKRVAVHQLMPVNFFFSISKFVQK